MIRSSSDDEQTLRDSFRVLRAVLKSAFRRHLAPLQRPAASDERAAGRFSQRVGTIDSSMRTTLERRYQELESLLIRAGANDTLLRSYRLADESISVLIEDLLLQLHELADQWLDRPDRLHWQRHHPAADTSGDRLPAGAAIRRCSAHRTARNCCSVTPRLKNTPPVCSGSQPVPRHEGGTLEQVLFATAAGISMVFATLVAFFAQSVYGQVSIPLFLALVIAYMFKDRIKESGRSVSAHILSRRLFDYRTRIQTQDGERDLGYVREKMVHVRPKGRRARRPARCT